MLKIILYLVLAYIAWRYVRKFLANRAQGRSPKDQGRRLADQPAAVTAHDLVRCAVCGSFVAERCQRPNCPQVPMGRS